MYITWQTWEDSFYYVMAEIIDHVYVIQHIQLTLGISNRMRAMGWSWYFMNQVLYPWLSLEVMKYWADIRGILIRSPTACLQSKYHSLMLHSKSICRLSSVKSYLSKNSRDIAKGKELHASKALTAIIKALTNGCRSWHIQDKSDFLIRCR